MVPIKFVHVLKRIEMIDRDISELKEIGENLPNKRKYRNTIKIATEKEINHLLNERVKLMELKVENPPENLMDLLEDKETEKPVSEVSFQQLEDSYLNRSKNQKINISNSNEDGFGITETKLKFESPSSMSSEKEKESPILKDLKPRTRAELLKDLPPLEY